MSRPTGNLTCSHCGSTLLPIRLPEGTGWEDRPQWVCFNDDCSYYQDGWTWMWDNYRVKASYRYRIADSDVGHASPLPVWSEDAMRDRIIEEKE